MDYKNTVVLVTGGTGSFGNYITHRLFELGAKEIRILSRDEKKQYDMKNRYDNDQRLKFYLGDIRDATRVDNVMNGVDIVYQAAALKQVPACEASPFEAVKTNIIGIENIIQSALKHNVAKVVCVSTDKAVKPVNVMGMTKAIQERLMLSANHAPGNRGTKFCVVRYGNVMLSRGSVIPFFRDLLVENKPLTITDEGMTRFLLTLNDAIDLVMYATEHTNGGETFVKKAPSSLIIDVARIVAELEEKEFKFSIIGKFPGEKIHEILITEEELQRTENKGDYFIVHPWWERCIFNDLQAEYSSGIQVVNDLSVIRNLIVSADAGAKLVTVD
ncbi:MAG: SDR family NAD(P)-dependent oxidoreductase [Sphingobacteriales bacterium]|nr:MAG: SDR family NAD(P)-dependent oxidoreductase [Sphingobacteriales bacterium]